MFDWPTDGKLPVPGLKNRVLKASLLDGGKRLTTTPGTDGLTIAIPADAPNKIASVVVLDIDGPSRTK